MSKPIELLDLDDAVLQNVLGRLTPKPHLFQLALVCKRFRSLATDGRLWLTVGSTRRISVGHRRTTHSTLKEAIRASRPGDTIVIDPGLRHAAEDLRVDWPLRIMGGGETPEETRLTGLHGGASAIDFRASSILSNVSVWTAHSTCITHTRGKLVIEGCSLSATPSPGLEHLFTPIVTTAASPPAKRRKLDPSQCGGGGSRQRWQGMPALRELAGGLLLVKETKIRGGEGMRAVHTKGTGELTGVRVINFGEDSLYWFEVDSQRSDPALNATAAKAEPQLPPWALSNVPLFPSGPPSAGSSGERVIIAALAPCIDAGGGAEPNDNNHSEEIEMKARSWDQRCL